MSQFYQDWEPVVVRKKAPTSGDRRDEKAVNQARRTGSAVETVKKFAAGANKNAAHQPTLNTKKLDEETDVVQLEKVSTELKKAIMAARLDKKLTQAQLAQQINEKPSVVQEYESGKAIPNQQVLAKMERILGVKLRGLK